MDISNVCKSYFNGFYEILNFKNNDKIKNFFAVVIALSIVIPLCIGAKILYGRISKKSVLARKDQQVNDVAKQNLNPPLNQKPVHSPLADEILEKASKKNKDDLKEIENIVLTKEFSENPTIYLVDLMIKRGVGCCRLNDWARAFVIGHIPNFAEDLSSIDFLRSIAKSRYDKLEKKDEMMKVLEGSFKEQLFLDLLKKATNLLSTHDRQRHQNALAEAESDLRLVLDVFNQAQELKSFHFSANAGLE